MRLSSGYKITSKKLRGPGEPRRNGTRTKTKKTGRKKTKEDWAAGGIEEGNSKKTPILLNL